MASTTYNVIAHVNNFLAWNVETDCVKRLDQATRVVEDLQRLSVKRKREVGPEKNGAD
jgi:hypothetical protein